MKTNTRSYGAIVVVAALCISVQAFAGSATWKANPATNNWNDPNSWTPATVPNGANDVATFKSSSVTSVMLTYSTEASGIVFDTRASAFAITAPPQVILTMNGSGITNNSGIAQNIVAAPDPDADFFRRRILFTNNASAGIGTSFTIGLNALLTFTNSSTADEAIINNIRRGNAIREQFLGRDGEYY